MTVEVVAPRPPSMLERGTSLLNDALTDIGMTVVEGGLATVEGLIGMADLAGRAARQIAKHDPFINPSIAPYVKPIGDPSLGKSLEDVGFRPGEARETLQRFYSKQMQEGNKTIDEAEGAVDTAVAVLSNPRSLAKIVGTSLPQMALGGVVGRAAVGGSAVLAGAVGEGAVAAGSMAESIRQASPTGTITGEQAGIAAVSGAVTGALSRLGGLVAQKLGIADVDTLLAAGTISQSAMQGLVKSTVLTALNEGLLEELGQSASEAVLSNVAQGKDPWENVGKEAVIGALAGAATGAGASLVTPRTAPPPEPQYRVAPPGPREPWRSESPATVVTQSAEQPPPPPSPSVEIPVAAPPATVAGEQALGALEPERAALDTGLEPLVPELAPSAPVVEAKSEELARNLDDVRRVATVDLWGNPVEPDPATRPVEAVSRTPRAGEHYTMAPDDIQVDAKRFQFKAGGNAEGVTSTGRIEGPWNELRMGLVMVWRDPQDGQTYVVNGHHRVEAAKRLGAERLVVRFLEAETAKEARVEGALTNITEDKGTAIDAAKLIRDSGYTPAQLAEAGLSPTSALVRDGIGLSQLSDQLFDRVATGELDAKIAAAVGEAKLSPEGQTAVVKLVERQQRKGRTLTPAQVRVLAADVAVTPEVKKDDGGQPDIFGNEPMENVAVEKAILRDWVSRELAKDKKLFGFVAKGSRAQELARGGNTIDVGQSKQIADEAAELKAVFDTLAESSGPIASGLTSAAVQLAEGGNVDAIRTQLLDTVRRAVAAELGRPAADGGRKGADQRVSAPAQAERRTPAPTPQPAPSAQDVAPPASKQLTADLPAVEPTPRIEHPAGKRGMQPSPADPVVSYDAGRIDVRFPKLPPDAVRDRLKQAGFRWSPENRVWSHSKPLTLTTEGGAVAVDYAVAKVRAMVGLRVADNLDAAQSDIADVIEPKPQPFTAENLASAFGISDEQAVATVALADAMGLDTSKILIVKGGTPGSGALPQDDLFDTGEAQPRLPGAEDVRDVEQPTPKVAEMPEGEFRLTAETSKRKAAQPRLLFQGVESPFYSRLIRTVEQSPQAKASGAQWKATIRNSKIGVNQDEFALTRVDDLSDGTTYTKQEVLDYLAANQVTVEDVTLGGARPVEKRGDKWAVLYEDGSERIVARQDEARAIAESESRPTHFGTYQVPGGEEGSYREVFLTVPGVSVERNPVDAMTDQQVAAWYQNEVGYDPLADDPGMTSAELRDLALGRSMQDDVSNRIHAGWRDGHDAYSDIKNPIVRLRFNTRTANGQRILFLEEVQPPTPENQKNMPALFTKNWREIAFKWALRHAAENGMDAVAWTTGQQQADRYDIEKHVDEIRYRKNANGSYGLTVWKDGRSIDGAERTSASVGDIEALVGKEIAKRIEQGEGTDYVSETMQSLRKRGAAVEVFPIKWQNATEFRGRSGEYVRIPDAERTLAKDSWAKWGIQYEDGSIMGSWTDEASVTREMARQNEDLRGAPERSLTGENLRVGGQGLKKLYDVDFKNVVQGLPAVKKHGGKVGTARLKTDNAPDDVVAQYADQPDHPFTKRQFATVPALTITPQLRDAVMAGQALFQGAYHGSPHLFEQFSLQKIGSGEGAQAYGWGIYFASKRAVADGYRDRLAGVDPVVYYKGTRLTSGTNKAIMLTRVVAEGKAAIVDQQSRWLKTIMEIDGGPRVREQEQLVEWIRNVDEDQIKIDKPGRLYKVEIPENEDFLDWDRPLNQQSPKVKDAVLSLLSPAKRRHMSQWKQPGWAKKPGQPDDIAYEDSIEAGTIYQSDLVESFGGPKGASEALAAKGVAGIRYLDGNSRRAGEGSHNFVVFDDKLVQIMEFDQGAKASVEFVAGGKALVRALESPDVSSAVHEIAHVARRFLLNRDVPAENRAGVTDADITTTEVWAGAKDGVWTTTAEEKFARGFERYLRDKPWPPDATVAPIFKKLSAWLSDIYTTVAGSAIDINISPEMQKVFDRLVTRADRNSTQGEIDRLKQENARLAKPYRVEKINKGWAVVTPDGKTVRTLMTKGSAQSIADGYTKNGPEGISGSTKRTAPGGNASDAPADTDIPVKTGAIPKVIPRTLFPPDAQPLAKTGATDIDVTRPVELPELVSLARELAQTPQVVKRFRGKPKYGLFTGTGKGQIRILADLFKPGQEQQLAKTLAHEIGHLVDWLPDFTLKRGNVLGRLRSLRGFLKHTFTAADGSTIHRDDVRKELLELSKMWRGDWSNDEASYQTYRKKGTELYADALSVLLNNPGLLQSKAPVFYEQFFSELDKKPDVKSAYFGLQELLSGTREELIARRRGGVREMFGMGDTKAIDLEQLRQAEAEAARGHLGTRLRIELVDKNVPVQDRIAALEKRGVRINEDDDPRYALKELRYLGSLQQGFLERTFQPVYEATQAAGLSWTDVGEALFYERIIAGDRSEMANPRGITTAAASELYANLQAGLTPEQMRVLGAAVTKFRAAVREIAEDAYEAGLYKPELYEQMKDNPAWAAFRVIDHMEKDVTSKVHHQIGTLKDIQNPADATILKTLVTLRAIEFQKMKLKVFAGVEKNDPTEIEQAKQSWNGKGLVPVDPQDKKKVLVTYYERGKLRGKYVPKDVADAMENATIGQNLASLEALRLANGVWFRPVFTTLNLGFQGSNFARDFWRYWTNMKDATLASTVRSYAKAVPLARARAFGLSPNASPAQRQAWQDWRDAKEARILGVTFNDLLSGRPIEDTQIEELFAQHGLGGPTPPGVGVRANATRVLEFIKNVGDFIETLPKAAAMYELRGSGSIADLTPKQRAFIREKVGSPDFLMGGTLKPITNEVFLFSNAITQAIRADIAVATDADSRGSFWRKNATAFMLPVAFTFVVEQFGHLLDDDDEEEDGWLSDGWRYVQRILQGVSEYDKTNYTIIPLALDAKSNSVYLRLPRSDSGRLLAAILRKGLLAAKGDVEVMASLATIFDYMAGQVPGTTPALTLASDVIDYASGQNVYDSFRNREVFTRDEMDAGGAAKAKKFIGYEFQQMGGGIVYKFAAGEDRPREQTTAQKLIELPVVSNVVGRFLRISNYGHLERARKVQAEVRGDEARLRMAEKDAVADAIRLFQKEPPPNRTRARQVALAKDVVKRLYADASAAERATQARDVLKQIRMGTARGSADPLVSAVLGATSIKQKTAAILDAGKNMSAAEFTAWLDRARKEDVISVNVAKAVRDARREGTR